MIELFYSPGACSLVAHTALNLTGLTASRTWVSLAQGHNRRPEYLAINPEGRVPTLRCHGQVLTESIGILGYLHALAPSRGVLPSSPVEYGRAMSALSFFVSAVHVGFAQVWRPERFASDESMHSGLRAGGIEQLRDQFLRIDSMCEQGWLGGVRFCAADVYPAVFRRWAHRVGIDVSAHENWRRHVREVLEQPALRQALQTEGLTAKEFAA